MAAGSRLPVSVVLAYDPESPLDTFTKSVEGWVKAEFGAGLSDGGAGTVTVDWTEPADSDTVGAQLVVADSTRGVTWSASLLQVEGVRVVAVSEAPIVSVDAPRPTLELSSQLAALLSDVVSRASLTLAGRALATLAPASVEELGELVEAARSWSAPGLLLGITKPTGSVTATQQKVLTSLLGIVVPVEVDGSTVKAIAAELGLPPVQPGCLLSIARSSAGITGQVVPATSLQRQPDAAIRLVLRHQLAAPLPFSLDRERGLLLARLGGDGGLDGAAADELLDEAGRKLSDAEQRLNDCQLDLELAYLEQDDVLRELDAAQSRLRFLERAARERGELVIGEPEPDDDWVPDFCVDALSGTEVLEFLDIPAAVVDGARELDDHPKRSLWAKKIWSALRALNDYAGAKHAERFSGDLTKYRTDPPDEVIPLAYEYAAKESQSTSANADLRRIRTFTVPEAVSADRKVYMEQHVKVDRGGANAPRIHLYDDTDGATKKVHIGYIGPHLPTSSGF